MAAVPQPLMDGSEAYPSAFWRVSRLVERLYGVTSRHFYQSLCSYADRENLLAILIHFLNRIGGDAKENQWVRDIMFDDFFSFGAVTSDISSNLTFEFSEAAAPVTEITLGEIDVTFPSFGGIFDINAAPVAESDNARTDEGQSVTVNVLENDYDADGDTISLLAASEAANGSVSIENGAVVYTPDEGFSGGDSFTYTIFDGLNFSEATVDVVVEADEPMDGGTGGDKSGFELGQVQDWYNPAWGGGFNVTFEYTVNENSVLGEDLQAWVIDSGYTGPGEIVHVWVNSFNGPTSRPADGSFDIGNLDAGFQPDLQVGDTFSVSFQVNGAGFDEGHFCPTFIDSDPEEFEATPSDVAITASPTNDWGSGFLQNVEIANVSGEEIEGWSVVLDVPEGDTFVFNNTWGATAETLDNGDILFTNLDWNEDINPGGSVNFGFTGDNTTDAAVAIDEFDFTWLG